jgi:hypothetical protein
MTADDLYDLKRRLNFAKNALANLLTVVQGVAEPEEIQDELDAVESPAEQTLAAVTELLDLIKDMDDQP